MSFVWNNSFKKAYKKAIKNPKDKQKIIDTLQLLSHDPYDVRLKTHKLHGKLKDTYSCYLDYDLRIIFDFERKEDDIVIYLIDIGNHDDIY
jgi:mRNA interferase YafQ